MEDQKKLNNPAADEARSAVKKLPKGHLSTNDRKAASEDVRHLNAEQDEEQLRKDEEARRNHKSK